MSDTSSLQHVLDDELQRLLCQLRLGVALTVCWRPNPQSPLAGEVKGITIYIYDRDREHALATLRHEVVDYCVSHAITPYRNVVNHLIKAINDDAYQRKEAVVDALLRLLAS